MCGACDRREPSLRSPAHHVIAWVQAEGREGQRNLQHASGRSNSTLLAIPAKLNAEFAAKKGRPRARLARSRRVGARPLRLPGDSPHGFDLRKPPLRQSGDEAGAVAGVHWLVFHADGLRLFPRAPGIFLLKCSTFLFSL